MCLITDVTTAITSLFASSAAGSAAAGATAATSGIIAGAGSGLAGAAGTGAAITGGVADAATMSTAAAGSFPWLLAGSTAAGLGGSVISAYGQTQAAKAQSEAATYNAEVAGQNRQNALQNVNIIGQSGEAQTGIQSQQTRAKVGGILANQAASGIDVNSGSAVDVRSSADSLGELDALTVQSDAVRQAFGMQVQAENFQAQGNLDQYEAQADITAGTEEAAGTLLGGAGNAAANWARYQQYSGGFTGS